jgi:hypothetical protein
VAHPSQEAAKKYWDAFYADSAFPESRKQAGPLIEKVGEEYKVDEVFMCPTVYSAMKSREENWSRMNALRNCALVDFGLCVPQFAGTPGAVLRNESIATWAASPEPTEPDSDEPLPNIEDRRERVRVSIGGAQVGLRLSNDYGSRPPMTI